MASQSRGIAPAHVEVFRWNVESRHREESGNEGIEGAINRKANALVGSIVTSAEARVAGSGGPALFSFGGYRGINRIPAA